MQFLRQIACLSLLFLISCQPTVSQFMDQCMTPAERLHGMEKIANDASDVLTDSHTKHWLDSGTLIGAYRFSSHMPYDDDVDFGLLRSDFETNKNEIKQKLLLKGYSLFENSDHSYQVHSIDNPNNGHVDLFLFEPFPGKEGYLKLSSKYWHERAAYAGYEAGFPRDIIFHPDGSLQEIYLLGKIFHAPVNIDAYLKRWYNEPNILTNFMMTQTHGGGVCSHKVRIKDIREDPKSLKKMFDHLEKVYEGRFKRSDSRLAS